jgi:peptide/nickel transport system substrate-binding protein
VGTGPYLVKEYVPDNHLVFEANPNYWGDKPAIREIEVRFVNDGTSALNALKAGEADGNPYLGQELWERMTKEGLDKSMALETYPQGGSVFFLNFNSTKSPSDNVDFRRALVKSIDRQQFVDLFNAPWGIVPTCDLAGPDKASMDHCVDTYDVDGAKSQLAASGVGDTPVELTSVTDIGNLVGPSDLAVSFFEAAGANVTRTQLDLARFSQVVFSGKPPQYGVTVMTTEYNLTQMASCPDPAKVGWKTYCDADITKMLEDADRATSEEERDQLLAAAQQKLQEDAVIVPIMASKGAGLLSKDLKGWTAPRVVVAIPLASLHW